GESLFGRCHMACLTSSQVRLCPERWWAISRQRFTAQQRSELLEQFESCGLSVADFATQHGIGTSTFFSWLRQRRRRPARAANKSKLPSSPFQEISLKSSLVAPGPWAGEVQ